MEEKVPPAYMPMGGWVSSETLDTFTHNIKEERKLLETKDLLLVLLKMKRILKKQ